MTRSQKGMQRVVFRDDELLQFCCARIAATSAQPFAPMSLDDHQVSRYPWLFIVLSKSMQSTNTFIRTINCTLAITHGDDFFTDCESATLVFAI